MGGFNLNFVRNTPVLEKDIEKRVNDYGKKLGVLNRKYKTPAIRGAPDRIYFTEDGRVFWIEFKTKKGRLTQNQKDEIHMMRSRGLTVFVINDIADGKFIMDVMA